MRCDRCHGHYRYCECPPEPLYAVRVAESPSAVVGAAGVVLGHTRSNDSAPARPAIECVERVVFTLHGELTPIRAADLFNAALAQCAPGDRWNLAPGVSNGALSVKCAGCGRRYSECSCTFAAHIAAGGAERCEVCHSLPHACYCSDAPPVGVVPRDDVSSALVGAPPAVNGS